MVQYTPEGPYRDFPNPFKLSILNEEITWIPSGELLYNFDSEKGQEIAEAIETFIYYSSNYTSRLSVTPVGPHLLADLSDPYAVIWSATSLYGKDGVKVEGDAPTLKDMGLDEEDESIIVY